VGGWRKLHNERSFITCMLHQILLEWSNQGRWDGWGK
jgi:hypothetical protein